MIPGLTFQRPEVLWLLLLVPLFVAGRFALRRRPLLRFSSLSGLKGPRRGVRAHLYPWLGWLRAAAYVLWIIALARPQASGARVRDFSVEGIDIVIALDLSSSMEAGDFRPNNRLHVAKQVLTDFLSSRQTDRIGLVVFSGVAYTQAPLTLDYGVLKEVVKQLRTRVLEDGTAIGDAIATSLNRLRDSDAKSRVVVLITDGDNNAGKISPLDAAQMAKSLHIPIYSILVGRGGLVPFPAGEDLFGNTAWREVEIAINPELLQEISRISGGEYYRATDGEQLRLGLQKVLDSLERSKLMEGGAGAHCEERFHPFLLAGFLLAALDLLLRASFFRVLP
jgi:Ca-activated chloride channel family protein